MIIVYVLGGINSILLIILLIKAFSKNKLNNVIHNNTATQNEKLNNLLNYIKQLDDKVVQTSNESKQIKEAIQQIANAVTNIEEETKRIEETVRKEISLTRIEMNNHFLRSREKV